MSLNLTLTLKSENVFHCNVFARGVPILDIVQGQSLVIIMYPIFEPKPQAAQTWFKCHSIWHGHGMLGKVRYLKKFPTVRMQRSKTQNSHYGHISVTIWARVLRFCILTHLILGHISSLYHFALSLIVWPLSDPKRKSHSNFDREFVSPSLFVLESRVVAHFDGLKVWNSNQEIFFN